MHSINNRVSLSRVETMVSKIWGLRFCSHHACRMVGELAVQLIIDIIAKFFLCLVLQRGTIINPMKGIVIWGLVFASPAKWCLNCIFSGKRVEGTVVLPKSIAHAKSLVWEGTWCGQAGPSRKHGHSRELKGSWSRTSDQGSDDGKPLAWLRIFQDFLLCNSPPPHNLPILDELILFKVNCLRN